MSIEKYKAIEVEDFSKTIKCQDFAELEKLKEQMYEENYKENIRLFSYWYKLVKALEPKCEKSRLHHFLKGSSLIKEADETKSGRINDLEGDFSAEKFLRAGLEERKEMVSRLEKLLEDLEADE